MKLKGHLGVFLFLLGVIALTGGCTTPNIDQLSQSIPSSAQASQDDSSKSYTEKVTSTVGLYYDDTIAFLTDECGVAGYSIAAGKIVVYGIGGSVWGVSEAALHGALNADSIEGVVIAAAIGSGIGLIGGMKNAYDDLKAMRCGVS